jgi:anti-sigma factor RsiW
MRCEEAQELITAHVDNELDAEERSAVHAHLQSCADCTAAYAREQVLKRQLHLAGREVSAPAALRHSLETNRAAPTAIESGSSQGRLGGWFKFLSWRPALVAAMVLVAVGSFLYMQRSTDNLAVAAIEAHRRILSGKTTLARSDDPATLRKELARAVGDRFQPVAFDLSMMQLYPVAGFIQTIAGRDVLVTVYRGAGPDITCFTFLGSEADAPDGAEKFYDADMRVNFYSFSSHELSAVLHKEGNVICVLVSKMTAADLLAVIRGKSAHAKLNARESTLTTHG